MKDIEFLLKIQGETTELLCSLFENPATFYEDNKGAIALEDSPQIWPRTKHTAIKYHKFRIFIAYGDVEIKCFDTK